MENIKFEDILELVKTGCNLFITGGAGTGKSYTLNKLKEIYKDELHITSTTGISAINVNGQTIHSWAGIGIANKPIDEVIKKIKQKYPELKDYKINEVFKSITFDNGVEFSKWEDIEKYLKTKTYFAHPYCSCERGSNENGNKLLRIFLPKSCNINEYTEKYVENANELINTKIRKILGYKSSLELFNIELEKLTLCD